MASYALILSCEHGGNIIPPAYKNLFIGQDDILKSHRGWDPGALEVANFLSQHAGIPLVYCTTSRLLIEMNRTLHNPELFSIFSTQLSNPEKEKLIDTIYLPYRRSIEKLIEKTITENNEVCLHFSIHSFTPIFNGKIRSTDIGILFDPSQPLEVDIAYQMKVLLRSLLPGFQLKFNDPYQGTDDGLTSFFRTKFQAGFYAGIEIEISQKWVGTPQLDLIKSSLEKCTLHFSKQKPIIS